MPIIQGLPPLAICLAAPRRCTTPLGSGVLVDRNGLALRTKRHITTRVLTTSREPVCRCLSAGDSIREEPKPRIDRLALEREHTEDALVHAAKRLAADEPFESFDSERGLADGERALAAEPALAEPFEVPRLGVLPGRR